MKKLLAYNSWISSKWRMQSEIRYSKIIKMAKSMTVFFPKGKKLKLSKLEICNS